MAQAPPTGATPVAADGVRPLGGVVCFLGSWSLCAFYAMVCQYDHAADWLANVGFLWLGVGIMQEVWHSIRQGASDE